MVLGAILEAEGMDAEIGEVLQHAVHACTTFLGVDNLITTTVRWMTSILSKEREPFSHQSVQTSRHLRSIQARVRR